MRKTKIICTLGPSTDKEGVLRDLIANGMNVARFNFSHGSHEEHLGRLEKLKALREELGKPVGSDVQKGKTTFVTLHGVEGTRALAARTTADACDTLAANFGEASAFLCAFAQSLISRTM